VYDDKLGWRVSTGAFNASCDGWMSVDLEQLLAVDRKPIDYLFPSLPRAVALVAHSAGFYRGLDFELAHQALWTDYYHGGVRGEFRKKGRSRKLRDYLEFVVPINEELASAHAHIDEDIV
jgi:hypothetical protein